MSDDLIRAIGQLEGRFDGFEQRLNEGISDIKQSVDKHGNRITSLEHSRSHAHGFLAAASAAGAAIGAAFTLMAKKIGIA